MKNKTVPIAFLVVTLGCGGSATSGSGGTGAAGAGMSPGAIGGAPIGGFGGASANGGGEAGVSAGGKGSAGNGSGAAAGSVEGGASGEFGAAGAAGTTCGELTALDACFNTFCQANGAGTPFCACFTRGYDLSPAPDCDCIALDSIAFCQQAEANGLDGANLNCASATAAVALQCVAAQ
jgi:hypothetical protein